MTTAALVLAAGGGTRFEGSVHKLQTSFRGRPLVQWAIDAAGAAGFEEVIVTAGAVELRDLLPEDVTLLINSAWADGLAGSLQLGIEHCRGQGHTSVVVGLADQPLVPSSAWREVASVQSAPIAVATYRGVRGNPVRLGRSVWPSLPLTGDEGARGLIRNCPDLVVEVPCEGDPTDVDTLDDLAHLARQPQD